MALGACASISSPFFALFFFLCFQDIVLYLLENGADIDMFNNHNNTPFFLATESLQKEICQVKSDLIYQAAARLNSSITY